MDRKVVHIKVDKISKSFKNDEGRIEVLKHVSLEIYKGEFLTFFGPNGCGKSTLVNILAGIEEAGDGEITFPETNGKPKIGFVFQNYRDSLMPWLNVEKNICFPLKLKGITKSEQKERLKTLISEFEINIDLKSKVYNLSGGQAQMVSILRGLIVNPEILIMDEPFSALDYQTNLMLYEELLKIWRKLKITVILISHEIDEAIYLGDRVAFLSKKPASIFKVLNSDLPRPRKLEDMGSQEFAELKKKALEIFRNTAT
ncbi:MAG: ABC transporter ATP-binding protein [Bacteroidales bacterium]|nr:ABC transporter ATP-binding protein [Bacteroidales bacterium]